MLSLLVVLVYGAIIVFGGAKFVEELRPSKIEKHVPDGENVQLSGEVYQKEERETYQILYLKNNSVNYQEQSFKESKLIIYDEKKENINIGNYIVAHGAVSIYQKERNPGNFNQKLYYQKQNIHAMVWSESIEIYEGKYKTGRNLIKERLYQFRQKWKEHLYKMMGEENGAILTAMLLGEKSEMDEEIKAHYQVNGIGHILAISGLHLSVIGVGIYQVIRRMTGSYTFGGIAGMIFLTGYVIMIGIGVSVMRAFIMFLFRVGADMVGRKYDSITALFVAAVVVLFWRPLYLYDGGFWMSFGAVFAILLALPVFQGLPLQSFWVSVSINAVLFPVQLYYFYEFPTYSIVINLWVIPLMSGVLLLGIIGSAMSVWIGVPGDMLLRICNMIFWIYEKSCDIFLQLPGARFVAGQPEWWQIAGYYCILSIAIFLGRNVRKTNEKDKKKEARRKKLGVFIAVMAFGVIPLGNLYRWYGRLQITVMDVGQGDGIFLRGPTGTSYYIDGGSSDVTEVGTYRIGPFLRSQGVKKIEYLLFTHGDADHTNGWKEIIEDENYRIEIETIIFPMKEVWDDNIYALAEEAEKQGIQVACMKAGSMLIEGDLQIECLGPENDFSGQGGNAASLLLKLKFQEFDMLFTGDTEGEGEEALIKRLEKQMSEVEWDALKVAHHGSGNSSSEELLQLVKPKYAFISAGQNNRYQHPHEETLKRLEAVESHVLVTKEKGAITVVTNGEKMWIKTHL